MALLSLDMIREIRGVADAYAARERARVVVPAHGRETRCPDHSRPVEGSEEKR